MPYATRQGIIDFPKKKLVKRDQKRQLTPVKEIPQSNDLAISSSARKALHNSNVIIGREKELEKLTRFLMSHLNNQTSGSIYLSGLPGTGKTACVNYLIEQNQVQ